MDWVICVGLISGKMCALIMYGSDIVFTFFHSLYRLMMGKFACLATEQETMAVQSLIAKVIMFTVLIQWHLKLPLPQCEHLLHHNPLMHKYNCGFKLNGDWWLSEWAALALLIITLQLQQDTLTLNCSIECVLSVVWWTSSTDFYIVLQKKSPKGQWTNYLSNWTD